MSNSHYSEEFDYKRKNFSFCITYSRLNSHFSFFCVFHAIWMLIQTMEQLVRIFRMEIVTCNFHNYLPLALDIAWARGSHRHILTLHRHTYYDEILDFWGMHHEGKGGTRHHQKSPLFSFLFSLLSNSRLNDAAFKFFRGANRHRRWAIFVQIFQQKLETGEFSRAPSARAIFLLLLRLLRKKI